VRLTEDEAYYGADDPGSHDYCGKATRNAVMFGPRGHMHSDCAAVKPSHVLHTELFVGGAKS
jgi:3-methyladenine DNA glycosylase Mpg